MVLRMTAPPLSVDKSPDAVVPGTEAWWQTLGYDTRSVSLSDLLARRRARGAKDVD